MVGKAARVDGDARSGRATGHPGGKRSEAFGAAVGTLWIVAIAIRGLQWAVDANREATPWLIERVLVIAAFTVACAGWVFWRLREWRAAHDAGLGDLARPWIKPVLAVAALLGSCLLLVALV